MPKSVKIYVGGKEATIVGQPTQQPITITLPVLEVTGTADVRVLDKTDNTEKSIATGAIRYLGAAEASPKPNVTNTNDDAHPALLVFYVLLIVLFPFTLMWTDILKAYKHASTARQLIIGNFSKDKLNLDEIKILVADLEQSPPGIPGLARATLAFTLLLVIGIFIFHASVISKNDLPSGVDKLLTILGTALTSIIGFYFGSKAAQTSPSSAGAKPSSSAAVTSPVIVATPNHGRASDPVTLTGAKFGTDRGNIFFGGVQVQATDVSWDDALVKVKVPSGAQGKVQIKVTLPNGATFTSAPDAFAVDP
ncbi:MAG TPA: IPT/TIG domain-containing protein [Candidatus Angelobacter sp.]|nr:IPT/TIG domain-containing protein [Candidatus Angelobacter sp.]